MLTTLITQHTLICMYDVVKFFTGNCDLVHPCHRFVTVWQFPVVELVGQAGVHGRELVHSQVDLVEAFPVPVQQQPRGSAGDRRGVCGRGQASKVHPLAAQALVGARLDGEGTRLEAADDVHIRLPKGPGVTVLLPNAQEGPEFGSYARFFKDFSNCCVSCVREGCTHQ